MGDLKAGEVWKIRFICIGWWYLTFFYSRQQSSNSAALIA